MDDIPVPEVSNIPVPDVSSTTGLSWWQIGGGTIVGAVLAFLPKLLTYLKEKRDQNHKYTSESASIERQDLSRLSTRYQSWQDNIEKKLTELEKDYLESERDRAGLRVEVSNLKVIIAERDKKIAHYEEGH